MSTQRISMSTTDANKAPLLAPPELSWPTKQLILRSGRSWWMVRYADGKVLCEWDTVQPGKLDVIGAGVKALLHLPIASVGGTSQWEDIPKRNMRGLYLVCPVGAPGVAALEANGDYLFFQCKTGFAGVGVDNTCTSHVIGKVVSDNGRCICYAWDYRTKKINRFEDNVTHMAYEGIGRLNLDPVGLT